MKEYCSIMGPSKAPRGPCIAFYKHDGSLIRVEWTRKRGWDKFGSRHVLIDATSDLGDAVAIFEREWAEPLTKTIKDCKDLRSIDKATAFLEFVGPNSFAGWHDPSDIKKLVLIDFNVDKRGIMIPRDFLNTFGHLPIAEVIYEGNFGIQFIRDIRDGKYPVKEGVVAKGVNPHLRGRPEHGIWMAKAKTSWWFNELRHRAAVEPEIFQKTLDDNVREQEMPNEDGE